MKRITDPEFKYTNSADTDIRKTFARIRKEQKKQQEPVLVSQTKVFYPWTKGRK